jgi:predicted RNA polymerase sigma factor
MTGAADRGPSAPDPARATVEHAVRDSYGRLVAILAARTRDVAAAEDALSDALVAALAQWPRDGVPANPEGWLVAAARRRLLDDGRRAAVRERLEPELQYAALMTQDIADTDRLPDRRLELMFACADPAIDPSVHTPLMLQVVLGLDADVIAGAFLAAPSAMAQRLVRAKRKIRDAGIRFAIPEPEARAPRLGAVLDALYAAFGSAWDQIDGSVEWSADGRTNLRDESLHLARMVVHALPQEPEPKGLLALLLYCTARDATRRSPSGAYVPLDAQPRTQWNEAQIAEAERLLVDAAAAGLHGRYQLEAAIQSAHLASAYGAPAEPHVIPSLYDQLVAHAPTVGAYVNRAAAYGRAYGAARGLAEADRLAPDAVRGYQPWWALRAHLLAALGRHHEAAVAREQAAGLTADPAVRAFLLRQG